MAPQITWLMAVKNGMPYITETLASIEAQTVKDWTLLVWDNGSTDGTVEELSRWIPSRLPGRVITGRPLGLGASLAAMVEMAETELCARIDDDDVNLPNRLERQLDFMTRHPNVAVLGTQITLIDDESKEKPGSWTYPCDDASIRWRLRFAASLMHPSVMFRRSMILSVGNYRDVMPQEDQDLWLRVAMKHPVANLPERLVQYRRRAKRVARIPLKQGIDSIRELVTLYAGQLFPGLSMEQVMRLNEILSYNPVAPIAPGDRQLLRTAATAAAMLAGLSPKAFIKSSYYRFQDREIRLRRLRAKPVIGPLLSRVAAVVLR